MTQPTNFKNLKIKNNTLLRSFFAFFWGVFIVSCFNKEAFSMDFIAVLFFVSILGFYFLVRFIEELMSESKYKIYLSNFSMDELIYIIKGNINDYKTKAIIREYLDDITPKLITKDED
jgi:hypothetical protein